MAVSIRDDYPLGTARGCTCYTCGADRQGERVADWHTFIDGEGALRQCASCVREAAGLLGMIDPGERDDMWRALMEAQLAQHAAEVERDEARALVDHILRWDEKHPQPPAVNSPPMTIAEREQANTTPRKRAKAATA